MKAEITVKAISQKEKSYAISDIDGLWYSDFGTCPFKEGDKLIVEYEMNGPWKNIKSFKLSQGQTANTAVVGQPGSTGAGHDRIQQLIVRQSSLKAAVDTFAIDSIPREGLTILQLAETYEKWVNRE